MTLKPSDISSKIVIPAGITPLNDTSEFPSHYSIFGHGGMRTVTNLTDRNAIPADRRVDGMIVYVEGDQYYRLSGGITNADWIVFSSGGGTGAGFVEVTFVANDWTANPSDSDQLLITLTHNLNTQTIEAEWFEASGGAPVELQWSPASDDTVTACINAGNAFAGVARIISDVASGERNTVSNIGSGAQSFKAKVGNDFEFRTIIGTGSVTATQNDNDITLNSTAEANTASNTGSGARVFNKKTSADLEFRTLTAGDNVTITQNTDDITIASTQEQVFIDGTRVDNPNLIFNDNIDATVNGSAVTINSTNTNTTVVGVDGTNVTSPNLVFNDNISASVSGYTVTIDAVGGAGASCVDGGPLVGLLQNAQIPIGYDGGTFV